MTSTASLLISLLFISGGLCQDEAPKEHDVDKRQTQYLQRDYPLNVQQQYEELQYQPQSQLNPQVLVQSALESITPPAKLSSISWTDTSSLQINGTEKDLAPEYLKLLQQLEATGQLPNSPSQAAQGVGSRQAVQFVGQPPARPAPTLSPQVQAQRKLQEDLVQKNIREQERRDEQRLLQGPLNPRTPRLPIKVSPGRYFSLPTQAQAQTQEQEQPQQPDYPQYVNQAQYEQPSSEEYQVPERVSYSQVQFGSTKLPQQPRLLPHGIGSQTQFSFDEQRPSQDYERPQLVYRPQPVAPKQRQETERTVLYQQQPSISYEADPSSVEDERNAPQQYLIETTKVQQPEQPVVTIPRPKPQVYYRQPEYQDYPQYEQPQAQQQRVPSKSAIFVSTTARTPARNPYASSLYVNVPSQPQHHRTLSQSEYESLVNAGFKPQGQQQPRQDLSALYKRQERLIPRPVPLTEEQRRSLAKEGIRNFYRVESPSGQSQEESQPVTYVLAIGKPDANTQR